MEIKIRAFGISMRSNVFHSFRKDGTYFGAEALICCIVDIGKLNIVYQCTYAFIELVGFSAQY